MIFNISVIIIVLLTIIYIYNRKPSLKEGLAGCTIVDFSANVVAGTGIPSTVDFNVVAVGTNTIMHSTDSGETWSSGSASALHLKAAAMSGSNAIAVGTNTIMYSTNGGNTWSSGAASALHLKGVGISDTNAVAVGTNTILYSLNGGQTWSSGAASALHLMDAAISGLNAVAVGTNTILYSKDAGKTWSSGAASALHLKGVAISGSNAVAVGTNTILYSTDAGKTWSSAAASALHLKAVAISGPNVIAVGTNTILYSQDGGKTWNSGSASALHLTSVAISGSKAVVVGTNTILYSTDAGQTWSSGSASALHLTGVAFGGPAQVIPCSKNMTLQPGNSCMLKPKCSDIGQNPVSGTPVSLKYSCDANGLLKPPVAVKCTSGTQPCTIPSIPAHSTGTTTNCKKGGILQPNGVCAVKCDVGYVGDGGTFQYKCLASGSTFSQSASVKCNQTCSVLPSFPHNNMIPTTNVPPPASVKPCPVPLTNVTGSVDCSSGVLAAGASCNTSCLPSYTGTGGSYTCSKDGTLTTPVSATCVPPILPCLVNSTNASGCDPTLAPGNFCTATCNTGYIGGGKYTCSADGELSMVSSPYPTYAGPNLARLMKCAKASPCSTALSNNNAVWDWACHGAGCVNNSPPGCNLMVDNVIPTGSSCPYKCVMAMQDGTTGGRYTCSPDGMMSGGGACMGATK